jgi:hypothetical protein
VGQVVNLLPIGNRLRCPVGQTIAGFSDPSGHAFSIVVTVFNFDAGRNSGKLDTTPGPIRV